ncbi:DUF5803 family protein [Natrialbaceae archaeon GCM10025810]|uniref:DUF5803 family protein n=1 Tax=Halovalidus salilacus TaxID=3075124 RepID=UPI0036079C36
MTPNRRLVFAALAVALLTTTAGCSAVFGGISDEQLDREEDYDDLRERDADVAVDVEGASLVGGGEFRAVYHLDGTKELELYRSSLVREEALDVHSVRYWYPNGTELTGSELEVDQGRSATTVRVPDENGTLAFSSESGGKSFHLPAFVGGSYEVTLPDDHRTGNFLFGDVSPDGYDREIVGDTEHLTWDEIDDGASISIRYYLARDVPLFLGLIGVAVSLGGIGIAYYYRELKRLKEQREEFGIDVDANDDRRKRPPGL